MQRGVAVDPRFRRGDGSNYRIALYVLGQLSCKTKPALLASNAGSFLSRVMPGLVPGIHA
jgi:hypothetical protein